MNIAILPNITSGFTSSSMEIDYVRIYQDSVISTAQFDKVLGLSFFPNPVANNLTISLKETIEQNVTLRIFSSEAKLIKTYYSEIKNNRIELNDLGCLNKGMYFVTFDLEKEHYSFKIIKK